MEFTLPDEFELLGVKENEFFCMIQLTVLEHTKRTLHILNIPVLFVPGVYIGEHFTKPGTTKELIL